MESIVTFDRRISPSRRHTKHFSEKFARYMKDSPFNAFRITVPFFFGGGGGRDMDLALGEVLREMSETHVSPYDCDPNNKINPIKT